jgi:hypothetical protein
MSDEPRRPDYDPLVAAAEVRSVVRLRNGHVGRLLWWNQQTKRARVLVGGRRIKVGLNDIMSIVNGGLDEDSM